jgi:hypothetical protein
MATLPVQRRPSLLPPKSIIAIVVVFIIPADLLFSTAPPTNRTTAAESTYSLGPKRTRIDRLDRQLGKFNLPSLSLSLSLFISLSLSLSLSLYLSLFLSLSLSLCLMAAWLQRCMWRSYRLARVINVFVFVSYNNGTWHEYHEYHELSASTETEYSVSAMPPNAEHLIVAFT